MMEVSDDSIVMPLLECFCQRLEGNYDSIDHDLQILGQMANIMTGLDQNSIRKSEYSRRMMRDIAFNPFCKRLADAVWVDYLRRHWQFEAYGRTY